MKPTPLSALLADDLLLDRVGARLDTDDDLGSLLLAVAHHADTPIRRAVPARGRRPHRGLTVLAALGVAVSGATVAAAVELAPVGSDQTSGAPHLRGGLPRSLQALVMPFLAGTPFQGRLVLPIDGMSTGPSRASVTAEGLPGAAGLSVYPMGDPIVGTTLAGDPAPEKSQGKGTPNGGTTLSDSSESGTDQGNQGTQANEGTDRNQVSEPAVPASQPKPTPTPTSATPTTTNNGATGFANGQDNGQGNSQGSGQGNSQSQGQGAPGSGSGTVTTATGTTTGSTTDEDDPASRVPEKRKGRIRAVPQPPVTGVAPSATTGASTGTAGTADAGAATGTTTTSAATTTAGQ